MAERQGRQRRHRTNEIATIADVARLAEVSEATVSRALRDFPQVRPELRDRVRAAAAELHYVADSNASRLASGKTRTVGFVATQLTTWYVSQLSAGLEDVLHPSGNDLLVSALSDPAKRQDIRDGRARFRQRVDAAVLVDVFVGEGWEPPANEPPTIVVGERLASGASLGVDDSYAGTLAAQHLLNLGHRHVVIIGGTATTATFSPVTDLRTEGLKKVGAPLGVEYEELVGWYTIEGGRDAALQIFARPRHRWPTAIVALSDEMAFGVLQAARECSVSVPNDLSVVGFDDHTVSEAFGLTTIRQPVRQLGQRAAERVLLALEGKPLLTHEVLPVELKVRHTTAPAGTPS